MVPGAVTYGRFSDCKGSVVRQIRTGVDLHNSRQTSGNEKHAPFGESGGAVQLVNGSRGKAALTLACVQPVCAVNATASPDEVRLPGPKQTIEL
jgi:hypothetical protein